MAAAQIMTTEPTPLVTVLPCDRTLFSYLLGWDVTDDTPRIATGAYDEHPKLQAIACHRLAALEEAAKVAEEVARRAAAVADERNKRGDPIDTAIASEIVAEKIATAIRSLSQPVEGSAGASLTLPTSKDPHPCK